MRQHRPQTVKRSIRREESEHNRNIPLMKTAYSTSSNPVTSFSFRWNFLAFFTHSVLALTITTWLRGKRQKQGGLYVCAWAYVYERKRKGKFCQLIQLNSIQLNQPVNLKFSLFSTNHLFERGMNIIFKVFSKSRICWNGFNRNSAVEEAGLMPLSRALQVHWEHVVHAYAL